MFGKERRTERRYYFRHPASVRLQGGSGSEIESEMETVTENVSTHGLLVRCTASIALGAKVKVTLHFPSIQGVGDVLRVEQAFGEAFLIAVGCQTPLEIVR